MVTGWAWEYVDDTLTPSRLRALRRVAETKTAGATPAPTAQPQGSPPMNGAELVEWIKRTGGKLPGS